MIISRTTHSTFTDIVSIRIVYRGPFVAIGTTYGATDGPGRSSMAAILGPGGPSVAINIATRMATVRGDHRWHDSQKRESFHCSFCVMLQKLAEFKYPSTCKRILVYFSGHGGNDSTLIMQDGKDIKAEDMISCFKIHISNNETLAEMAKMFFFDACRGSQQDRGYMIQKKSGGETGWIKRIPREGGVLVAYASTPYHVAYVDSSGSRWTNCLVRALKESKDNVCRVLTDANILLGKQPNSECQTAEYINNLRQFVYFKQEAIKT